MAVLIVEFDGTKRAAKLPRRVLIGRRGMNHLLVDHRAVSRMHAWIAGSNERYTISDARSRTGTKVNGERVDQRRPLAEGDVITIGPARLTFMFGDELPPDAEPLDLSVDPAAVAEEKGILFDCACGAP